MFLDYKLSIKKLTKNSGVIAINYDNDKKDTYIKDIAPIDKYGSIPYENGGIYKSVKDAVETIAAYKAIWKNTHLILYIPDNLLVKHSLYKLEHIVSSITGVFLGNVYTSKNTITLTHEGTIMHEAVANIMSMIEKVQVGKAMSMLPANIGTPSSLATKLQNLFKNIPNVALTILKEKYLQSHGYNLITTVGQGSQYPPCMLVVERKAVGPAHKTICIIGKGITFDTGGINVKPTKYMDGMKYDKTGAIYGSMSLLHLLEDPSLTHITFIGIFPFAENAISDKAVLPGNVVKSFIGKTVEITDTDAEGRLILADALGHSHKYKPDLIVDIATLTDHADNINCWHSGYCFVRPEQLKSTFEKLCEGIGERMLTMPNWNDYSDILKSKVADLLNYTDECGDSFAAALFLKEFVPAKSDWVHIDISHNLSKDLPVGNGIRSIILVVKDYLEKNKKK